ncbi:MAG: 30S ribosomal protein S16 [Alphaproteobacteria bacterium]|nr:MAG: 30S ribosomal protein S16 [Alphaproteobacteria bacterium]TAE83249.1 MAG: 30S ribosomal protein S16 [Alphaproteobacteria bacterium]TAF14617.1 MAG: 30S ribosomal protein S16 [Alphaproteobacteria bacterium]TAF41704.1 MAG: 30S ribosomal protein S16 [Alphaproteobacteria bacterium]TAF75645.1 MAG: 30S ribosomal protein S16 [Alphaproteobacteria bacterium]
MAVHLRLARGGSKKRPFYRLVAADVRAPRDGAFIEKLGIYNPMLPKDSADRFVVDADRVRYWIGTGAKPTEAVARYLRAQGLWNEAPRYIAKPKSGNLPPRAQARKNAEDAARAAAEAEAATAAAE